MFEEFGGGIFKRLVVYGNLEGHVHHVQCIHAHPAGAISVLQLHISMYEVAAVEYADIIQAKESTLEHIVTVRVLTIDPPGKIDDELLKDAFQKSDSPFTGLFFLQV